MKAALIRETGAPENIRYEDIETPKIQPGQILVETRAVAVNPIDTYIRAGIIPMQLPMPFIVGCDGAGVVIESFPGSEFEKGDRVWYSNQGLLGRQGTFAEKVVIGEEWAYSIPDEVSFESAAANALVGITAHLGLVGRLHLKAGETLFIRGGTGGVASTVIQIAKILDAKVITSTSSEAKKDLCLELGADHVIVGRSAEEIAPEVQSIARDGVDVWWETLRTPDFDLAVQCLKNRGRMALMAGRDARPEFPVGPFYVKELALHGFVMFLASAKEQKLCAKDLNEWMATGLLDPRIDRELSLSEAAEAHRLQESSTIQESATLKGKIVLTP